jgi:hypothetical protein
MKWCNSRIKNSNTDWFGILFQLFCIYCSKIHNQVMTEYGMAYMKK